MTPYQCNYSIKADLHSSLNLPSKIIFNINFRGILRADTTCADKNDDYLITYLHTFPTIRFFDEADTLESISILIYFVVCLIKNK